MNKIADPRSFDHARRRRFAQTFTATPHIVWMLIFIIVPMILVVYYSFTDKNGQFTLDNFKTFFGSDYSTVFLHSICFAFIATVISLLVAFPLAYFISRTKPRTQKILIMLIMLPMWTNFLIRTYSLMTIIETNGIINNFLASIGLPRIQMINTGGAVIFGMIYNYLPYMVLPIYTVMEKMDNRLIEAASDLGCNGWQVLTKVIIPLSSSGIVSGITMVFVPCVSTFYISQKLGGGKYQLIGDAIERQFQQAYNYNLGSALSFVLMILIFISMMLMNHFDKESEAASV
ncbi:MAG: ABC transporter permease [Ruminococcaceae bacterium]|nr:ABC transporter permease [Oscillospiraceae bacterium]